MYQVLDLCIRFLVCVFVVKKMNQNEQVAASSCQALNEYSDDQIIDNGNFFRRRKDERCQDGVELFCVVLWW